MILVPYSRIIGYFSSIIYLFTAACLFPLTTNGPQQPFQFTIAGGKAADTISPFGPLMITFSHPLINPDSVGLIFSPPFSEYQILWNGSQDTATLNFALPLEGNTSYGVRLSKTIASTDGNVLYPWSDTLKIHTYDCEQEPNDAENLADTLNGTVFGHISMANDTDWYLVSDTTKRSFYLKSTGSTSIFSIADNTGRLIMPGAYADAETLSVPMEFVSPLFVYVYAYNYSNGGSYELGWVKKK
jgi:hypothetical protein